MASAHHTRVENVLRSSLAQRGHRGAHSHRIDSAAGTLPHAGPAALALCSAVSRKNSCSRSTRSSSMPYTATPAASAVSPTCRTGSAPTTHRPAGCDSISAAPVAGCERRRLPLRARPRTGPSTRTGGAAAAQPSPPWKNAITHADRPPTGPRRLQLGEQVAGDQHGATRPGVPAQDSRAARRCPPGRARCPARRAPAPPGRRAARPRARAVAACRVSSRRPAARRPRPARRCSPARPPVRHPDGGRAGQQVPAGRAGRVEPLRLQHRPHHLRGLPQRRERHAVDPRLARGRPDQAEQHPQCRGLAEPFGPRKPVTAPGSTVNLSPSTAFTGPKRLLSSRTVTRPLRSLTPLVSVLAARPDGGGGVVATASSLPSPPASRRTSRHLGRPAPTIGSDGSVDNAISACLLSIAARTALAHAACSTSLSTGSPAAAPARPEPRRQLGDAHPVPRGLLAHHGVERGDQTGARPAGERADRHDGRQRGDQLAQRGLHPGMRAGDVLGPDQAGDERSPVAVARPSCTTLRAARAAGQLALPDLHRCLRVVARSGHRSRRSRRW